MRAKVLVTGGAGFIGSHVVDALVRENARVLVLDNLSSGKKANVNPGALFYYSDIRKKEIASIFSREKPDIVFHFAGHIEARDSVQNPIFDAQENILGALNIIDNCRRTGVKKIIFASSGGEIYGQAKEIPTSERCFPRPISPYGVAKFSIEKYLEAYLRMYGLDFVSLRLGNVFGPRQRPDGEAGVVAIFTKKMLEQKEVFIHGQGKQTKDYIFIDDVVEAALCALKQDFWGIVNIGTGRETSVLDIFSKIKYLTGYKGIKKHIPLPACSFARGCLSREKAQKELGWKPKYDLQGGLEKTVSWFMQNPI